MDDYSKIIDKIEKSSKFTMKMYINLIDEYGKENVNSAFDIIINNSTPKTHIIFPPYTFILVFTAFFTTAFTPSILTTSISVFSGIISSDKVLADHVSPPILT